MQWLTFHSSGSTGIRVYNWYTCVKLTVTVQLRGESQISVNPLPLRQWHSEALNVRPPTNAPQQLKETTDVNAMSYMALTPPATTQHSTKVLRQQTTRQANSTQRPIYPELKPALQPKKLSLCDTLFSTDYLREALRTQCPANPGNLQLTPVSITAGPYPRPQDQRASTITASSQTKADQVMEVFRTERNLSSGARSLEVVLYVQLCYNNPSVVRQRKLGSFVESVP